MKQVKEDSLIAEAYSLVAEHNNPEALQYKGFIYKPAMEHTGDGRQYIEHYVTTPDGRLEKIRTSATTKLTLEEFAEWVDKHVGGDMDARFADVTRV